MTPAGQTGGGRQRSLQRDGAIRIEPQTAPAISGSIIVDIPATMCASEVELVVSRTIRNGRLHVFQAPVSPESCRGVIRNTRAGEYYAVLHKARGDRAVIALSRFQLSPRSQITVTPAPLGATLEGRITMAGVPIPDTYVQVLQSSGQGWSWDTRTGGEGRYTLRVQPDGQLCLRVILPRAFNPQHPRCDQFVPGPNAVDVDLRPGTVEVVIEPKAGPIHKTQVLLVISGMSTGVTVTSRIEGRVVDLPFGRHEVRVTTMDYQHTFDSAQVVISAEQPTAVVTLRAPYSQ